MRLSAKLPRFIAMKTLAHNPRHGESPSLTSAGRRKISEYADPSQFRACAARPFGSLPPRLLGFGAGGLDLVHNLHGVFAAHAVNLEDRLNVGVDGLHLGGLNPGRIEHRSEVGQ